MSPKLKTDLEWGETVWDDLSREELLREVQRMFSALKSAYGVLRQSRRGEESSPFWTKGVGYWAMTKVEYVLKPFLEDEALDDLLYHCFFRPAETLLFGNHPELGFGWVLCTAGCKNMAGRRVVGEGEGSAPENCPKCGAKMRPFRWSDLEPHSKDPKESK